MREIKKACRQCGYLGSEKICPICGSNAFADKFKGKALILDAKNSEIAKKINVKNNGQFALKFS